MVQTTRLQLPLIAAAQAQKHVTHNEAILRLDGLCQMQVLSYTVSAEPASPADGDLYLLPAGKTGAAWGGAANHAVAHYYDGVWHFYTPRTGWLGFITDTSRLVYFNGTSWADVLTPSGASAADGSAAAPGFAFASDTDTGLYRIGANNPAVSAGGTKVLDMKSSGVAVLGTNTNDSAAAGFIGEFTSSSLATGSAVSLTTATPANITSLSLTAGDWDVTGAVCYKGGATTSLAQIYASIGQTSATLNTTPGTFTDPYFAAGTVFSGGREPSWPLPTTRLSLSSTTTVYLVGYASFTVSTCSAYGILRARRVR